MKYDPRLKRTDILADAGQLICAEQRFEHMSVARCLRLMLLMPSVALNELAISELCFSAWHVSSWQHRSGWLLNLLMLTYPFFAASVASFPGATHCESDHLQPGRGPDMGLPAPAQGRDGKRVHVDPKGDIGAFAGL